MKRWIPWIVGLLALTWLGGALRTPKPSAEGFDLPAFARLPVLAGGRIKPLDTVARNSLMIISGKQILRLDDGRIDANRWLAELLFDPATADTRPVFLIDNPEVLGLFGWQQGERKRFSRLELAPFIAQIEEQGRSAGEIEGVKRSPYQTAILNLNNSMFLYQRLQGSMRPRGVGNFTTEIDNFAALAPAGYSAIANRTNGLELDREALGMFNGMLTRYEAMRDAALLMPVPGAEPSAWRTLGGALLGITPDGTLDPAVRAYAAIGDAFLAGDVEPFNREVHSYAASLSAQHSGELGRTSFEVLFNRVEPFYLSMGLCVLGTILACASWLVCGPELRRSAFWVIAVALVVHSFGLVARMYLQGRPPVTNLYSSAIFIGWGTMVIGLVLERIFKDGIGTACAGMIGFITLVIAHHLAGNGDTLEMLQAVLDTNIWLATHVVVITLGYSAMFLAGLLAIIHVVRGVVTRSLTPEIDRALGRMVYGVICFALLFSFVGTVLGGIWADQSWGRFWGWDPKENGALLIVLWSAIILHARWGGFIRRRGLMIMAIFGNVITSFSWFGVNMLGVGLHSYGFMNKAFPWLIGFVISQLVLMALAALPLEKWRSFRAAKPLPSGQPG